MLLLAGNPRAPHLDSKVEVLGGGNFRISWRTDSYASIEQYRLLYRKSPVKEKKCSPWEKRNISAVGQQPQLRLDQRSHPRAPPHREGEVQEQGNLHSQSARDGGGLPGQSHHLLLLSLLLTFHYLRSRCRLKMLSAGGKSPNSSLLEQTVQVRPKTQIVLYNKIAISSFLLFKTNFDEIKPDKYLFLETMPVESVRKEYSIFMNKSAVTSSSLLLIFNCLIFTIFLSKWWYVEHRVTLLDPN